MTTSASVSMMAAAVKFGVLVAILIHVVFGVSPPLSDEALRLVNCPSRREDLLNYFFKFL